MENTCDNQLSSRLGTIFCWVGERIVGWQLSVLSLVVEGVAAGGMEQLEDDAIPMRRRTEQRQDGSVQQPEPHLPRPARKRKT